MAVDQQNRAHVGRVAGKTVLFIGVECRTWSLQQFADAARVARNLGIDTISPKRLDGTVRWYGTPEHLQAECHAVNAEGIGYLPFAYCYGPRFGLGFVDQECAVLEEMANAIGALQGDGIGWVCADMEVEWNGRVDAAQRFAGYMARMKHLLYITSWANPGGQAWSGVLNTLRPCMNAYVPQAYNDYLSGAEYREISQDICIQTAVDLSQEFGTNHPANVAQQAINHGQTTIWMWDYILLGPDHGQAVSVVNTARQIVMPGAPAGAPAPAPALPPPPPPAPAPAPAPVHRTWTVRPGQSLSVIAESAYGNAARWTDIWNANRAVIGNNPNFVRPGEVLALP